MKKNLLQIENERGTTASGKRKLKLKWRGKGKREKVETASENENEVREKIKPANRIKIDFRIGAVLMKHNRW